MATAAKKTPFLPAQLRVQIARIGKAVAGLSLITISLILVVALFSYQSGDPSFNTATGDKARNLMGDFGAIISDFYFRL